MRSREGQLAGLIEAALLSAAVTMDLLVWNNDNELQHGWGIAPSWVIPLGTVMTFAVLVLRHRFATTVMIVQLAWACASGVLFALYTPLLGMLVALHTLARHRSPLRSSPWLAACAVPFALFTRGEDGPSWQIINFLVYMIAAGAAWLLGYRAWLSDQQAATQKAAEHAIRAERLRIARELHDIVSHAVSVMMIQSAGARAVMAVDPQRAEAALDTVQEVGRQSVNELHRLLGLLRSASTDGDDKAGEQQPGLDDIEALLARAEGADLTVRGVPGPLDPSVALTAYRLVQESITNALKHAGPDVPVHVDMAWTAQYLTISVRNNAPPPGRPTGPAPLSTGLGLIGLRERVQAVGGTMESGPTPVGFAVQCVLPVAIRSAPAITVSPEPERIIG